MIEMYELTDLIRTMDTPRSIVPYLFSWFETNSEYIKGSPGPFVHFIESQDDYQAMLIQSIGRKPSDATLAMANRLANYVESDEEKQIWIGLIEASIEHPDCNELVRESANLFIEHHKN